VQKSGEPAVVHRDYRGDALGEHAAGDGAPRRKMNVRPPLPDFASYS
jgi:hypothetical protein